MNLSPRSTVSSDLYSPFEPANPDAQLLPGQTESLTEDDLQSSLGIAPDDTEESGSDAMQGLDSGDQASRRSSVGSASISNSFPGMSHKRKREEDIADEDTIENQEGSLSQDHINGVRFRHRTDSHGSRNQLLSLRQAGLSMIDHSKFKRSKTNGQASGPEIGAQLFSKSSALPAILWQHILCYVPPVFLGRLLRVNHAFNTYLTPGKATEDSRVLPNSIIQPLKAEDIWIASRRRFAAGLPRPMHGMEELEMWRLLRGQNCQICNQTKEAIPATNLENPFEFGPGDTSVRIIWPFAVRCCGSCLRDVSKKEMDLFLSTDCPSFLLQALPFAFVTETNHYIAHSVLRNSAAPPPVPLTKRYYKPHIEDIKRRFEDAKELGTASAEEWIKGLASRGQERLEEIIRWEQWESKGGLRKVNTRPKVHVQAGNRIAKPETHSERSTPQSMALSARLEGGQASPAPLTSVDATHFASGVATPPLQHPWISAATNLDVTQHGSQTPFAQPRPARDTRDVNEAKAARKAEIERRCAALEPPLLPNVLNHMESFQAAKQITQPLTEQAWEILKPRLLAQRPYAERKERERVQQTEVLAEEYKQRRQQEAQLKETKENFDREWETFQSPVRSRIGALADEIIETRWTGARSLTKDISPKFAADVLVNVRQRFYAEIAQEDETALSTGRPVKGDPLNGPPTRKLILENMKYIFDTKIKPLTDHFQRELFLCNGCEGKFYGFEGVIQHYAAKHTTTLSMGNIVVHWRAEWPETPPFNPNPSVAKSAYYKVPTPAGPTQGPSARDTLVPTNYNLTRETSAPVMPQRIDNSQYSNPRYSTTYAAPLSESRSQVFPAQNAAYGTGTSYAGYAGHSGTPTPYASIPGNYNTYSNLPQASGPACFVSSIPPQSAYPAFAQVQPNTTAQAFIPGPNPNSYVNGQYAPSNMANGYPPNHAPNVSSQVSDLYQRQMDEMAKHAKDVFTSIGGVKDLPGSVRIYTVIQHTVSRFKATFPNEPNLSMFIDGLDHNAVMRPVRSVNGLGCKTCIKVGTSAKLYTLPHLVNHFRTVHVEGLSLAYGPEIDWKRDMIDLPELSIISNLVNAPGMTDTKLSLIASAFPEAFPAPLPSLRGRLNTGPLPIYRKELDSLAKAPPTVASRPMTDLSAHFQFQSNDQPYIHPNSEYRPSSRGTSSEPNEPPGEDEYDPHRPALLGKTLLVEPSPPGQLARTIRTPVLQNGHRSSFQARLESSQYAGPANDGVSYDNANQLRLQYTGSYTDRMIDRTEPVSQPFPPKPDLSSRSSKQIGQRAIEQNTQPRPGDREEKNAPMEYGANYGAVSEDDKIGQTWRSLRRGPQTPSLAEATITAEKFLSDSGPKQDPRRTREGYISERDVERHPEVPWLDETHVKRPQKYFGEGSTYDQASTNGAHVEHRRPGPSDSRNGNEKIIHPRPGSLPQYYEEYHPSTHIQIPLKTIRAEESPTVRFTPYESSQPADIHERHDLNSSASKRPRSGTHSNKNTRIQQYREAPESTHNSPVETGLYHPRSPVEEDRGEGVYQTQSPSLRRQSRPQRLIPYEYPAPARIEYVDEREIPEDRFPPRIQYVRYEDPGPREPTRYVVTRPVEQLEPEVVRYEHAYAEGPVYERSGQVFHASQRIYRQ